VERAGTHAARPGVALMPSKIKAHLWKDSTLDDSVWQHFQWLPEKLVSMWIVGVKSKHEKHGWGSMPGILWDVDTMTFFGCHDGLMGMLEVATKKLASEQKTRASDLLGIHRSLNRMLGLRLCRLGTRYPEAKSKADEILDTYFINNRKRLLDVYIPLGGQLDRTVAAPSRLALRATVLRRLRA
jgi:hypothetical protein